MADSSVASAGISIFLVSLGIPLTPPEIAAGVGVGLAGSFLVRAISPRESRVEAWLFPFISIFCSVCGAMMIGWLGWDFPPVLFIGFCGTFSATLFRIAQRVSGRAPELADDAIDIAMRKGGKK